MRKHLTFASLLILAGISALIALACAGGASSEAAKIIEPAVVSTPSANVAKTGSDAEFNGEKVVKSEEEWKKLLTPAAYHVLREEGTERPYSGEYDKHKKTGDYHCAACNLKLFSSKTKFESGTGWPSFYQPINKKNVVEKSDRSHGSERIEVECARCGSHLGHVFDDGPKPTGLRYCMNSVSLKFEKAN